MPGKGVVFNYERKLISKGVRTLLQVILLAALTVVPVLHFLQVKRYEPVNPALMESDKGFVAVSFPGANRTRKGARMDDGMLFEQLSALKESGLVTLTQQDVLDFYGSGGRLPEKGMLLLFEDGRRDTVMLVQPMLERLNYKATMLREAGGLTQKENGKLQPNNLLDMASTSFWELGSSGYGTDYDSINTIYTKQLGYAPLLYAILPTEGADGDAAQNTRAQNPEGTRRAGQMALSREGEAFNTRDSSPLELTRIQAQSYWYTNHLLMRIQQDTGYPMAFQTGDSRRAAHWSIQCGRAEFRAGTIILTTPPDSPAEMHLSHSERFQNVSLRVDLDGNVVGEQAIFLRRDAQKNSFIKVALKDNSLLLSQKESVGGETVLSTVALPVPAESDAHCFEIAWLNTARPEDAAEIAPTPPVLEALQPDIHAVGSRRLEIILIGSLLVVRVDGVEAAETPVSGEIEGGLISLYADKSESNTCDSVYDGVFTDLLLQQPEVNAKNQRTLFDNRSSFMEIAAHSIHKAYDMAIDRLTEGF